MLKISFLGGEGVILLWWLLRLWKIFNCGGSYLATCPPSWIFGKTLFSITAADFLEINRKHVFLGSHGKLFKKKLKGRKSKECWKKFPFLSDSKCNLHK